MKKKLLYMVSFVLAFYIFICPLSASALSVPNYFTYSSFSSELTSEYVDAFYSNQYVSSLGYTNNNSVLVYDAGTKHITCFKIDEYLHTSTSRRNNVTYDIIYCSGSNCIFTYYDGGLSSLGSVPFSNYVNATYLYPTIVKVNDSFYCSNIIEPSNLNYLTMDIPNTNYNCFFINGDYVAPYEPDYSGKLVGFPAGLEFSVSDFMQWLVDNDKIAVSADSAGVSVGGKIPAYIGLAKLQSFLEFYKQFGSSNSSFVSRIGSWFSYMNIAHQTNDNIVILKSTIDSLYREYINSYKVEFYPNTANQAHHRRDINTQTDDDNLTLVTDDSNDDIYTSLLREIVRGIVALQSSTVSSANAIIDSINNLDFTVNVANDGGNGSVDLSDLYIYDVDSFNNDLADFQADIEDVQNVPQGYIDTINQNSLMPENMLEDKNSLTVNIPTITGFTVGGNGSTYSTQTGSYVLRSVEYPWLDTAVQKIKRFASILLILGYLVHLRYRIPELIRGE